jgi:hypothetical protein
MISDYFIFADEICAWLGDIKFDERVVEQWAPDIKRITFRWIKLKRSPSPCSVEIIFNDELIDESPRLGVELRRGDSYMIRYYVNKQGDIHGSWI